VVDHPPTIIVVHPKERRRKCTVEPLRGRDDFVFWKFPRRGPESLEGYVRLGLDGPLLTAADRDRGLLVLDGTWKLAERMLPDYEQVPVRSLLPWRTAYPRVSKLYQDPAEGLATIEALFAAFWQIGRDASGLLDQYHWMNEFLQINSELMRGDCRS
jgi:pre-rRNA-processing protein TSR3